jgi:hypothetical protein
VGEFDDNLRDVLTRMQTDPDGWSFKPPSLNLPLDLQFAARQYLFTCLEKGCQEDFGPEEAELIFEREIVEGSLKHHLPSFYRQLRMIGLTSHQRMLRLFKNYIESVVFGAEPKFVSPLDKSIFKAAISGSYSRSVEMTYGLYILEYTRHTNLAHWNGNEWKTTALGDLFLRLTNLQRVHFLLSLETYLSAGEIDEYCMNTEFLSELLSLCDQEPLSDLYDIKERRGIYTEYIGRLQGFGLFECVRNHQTNSREYQITRAGRQVIRNVINPDTSATESVIRVLIDQQLNYPADQLPLSDNSQMLEDLITLVNSSPVAGDQKEKLRAGISSYKNGNYVGAHLSLIPAIEGLLRNLASIEGIDDLPSRATLRNYLEKFKSINLISENTFAWVMSLDRNGVLHSNLNPSREMAKPLCEIIMHVIHRIHADYQNYQ